MTTAEERAKLRAAAQWMQGDVLYINDPLRLRLLNEIEELSKALATALDGWESFARMHSGGAPFNMATIAELRKLVPDSSVPDGAPYR